MSKEVISRMGLSAKSFGELAEKAILARLRDKNRKRIMSKAVGFGYLKKMSIELLTYMKDEWKIPALPVQTGTGKDVCVMLEWYIVERRKMQKVKD